MKYHLKKERTFIVLTLCLALLLQSCSTLNIYTNPETACVDSPVEVSWINRGDDVAVLSASTLTTPAFAGEVSGNGSTVVTIDETTTFSIDAPNAFADSATTNIVGSGTSITNEYTLAWLGCSNAREHADVAENTLPSGSTIETVVNNTNIRISLSYGGRSIGIDPSEETTHFAGLPAGGEWQATHYIDPDFNGEFCLEPAAVVLITYPVDIRISVDAACK